MLFKLQWRIAALRRHLVVHGRARNAIVAIDAGDLFKQIVRPGNVSPMIRSGYLKLVLRGA